VQVDDGGKVVIMLEGLSREEGLLREEAGRPSDGL
jgi:hypothetical protein